MPDKFTLRRLPDGQPTDPISLDEAEARLAGRLARAVPVKVKVDTLDARDFARRLGALNRVDDAFRQGDADRVVVRNEDGAFAVKRIPPAPLPIIDTPGTRAVDRIYTAVHRQFDPQFMVRDMGICVDKPGEHGDCNAWDGGTDPTAPAEVQHERIEKMADFIRREGIKHRNSDGKEGEPAFGVIVMRKYWRVDQGDGWHDYTGVPHVVHFHAVGKPSFSGHL